MQALHEIATCVIPVGCCIERGFTMHKRILILVATVALAMGLVPALAFAAEGDLAPTTGDLQLQADGATSGTWGTCKWEMTADGEVTVHPGTANMGSMSPEGWDIDPAAVKKLRFVSEDGKKVVVSSCMRLLTGMENLEEVDLSGLDMSSATSAMFMFSGCKSLKELDLSGLDTSNLDGVQWMFEGCSSLKQLNLSGMNTASMRNCLQMFDGCSSLEVLDLSSFDTSNVMNMMGMFFNCSSLKTIYVSEGWTIAGMSEPATKRIMFTGCTSLVGGNGTKYDEAHAMADYANIDTADNPGYFTYRAALASYAGATENAGFTDLAADAWYLNEGGMFPGVKTLYLDYTIKRGLMSGYTGARKGQFGPDDDLSRGMAATIIYRMATGRTADTTNNNVTTKFSDVPKGAWYAAAVKWCAEHNVVTGYSGTDRFGPEDPITREQLATVIGRYMDPQAEAGSDVSQFKDKGAISDYAKGGITYCNKQGIMTGIGDTGNFDPQGKATRCQMSKVIAVTAYELAASGKEPVLDPDPIQTVHYSCSYMEMDMPESWEGNVRPRVFGHTSGAYHVDFYYGDEGTYGNAFTFFLFRVDGMEGSGQGACSWADLGDIVWQSKHASGSKVQYKFTDAELEEIIQLMTGGSVTLEQLASAESESACKAMAKEAVDNFMNNNVVPTVAYK